MLVKINGKKRNTIAILNYCFYVMDLIKEHHITGRFINVVTKDNKLISKWKIKYTTMIEVLKELEILSEPNKKYENIPRSDKAYKYHIDKSRLLITTLMCIGIGMFDGNTIPKVNKEGFDFIKVLNGIDNSMVQTKDGLWKETVIYSSKKEYEQKVVAYVYESLQIIVNYNQIHLYTDFDIQKTTILKYFQNIDTGISHYYLLKNDSTVLTIPENEDLFLHQLIEALHTITTIKFHSLHIPTLSTLSIHSLSNFSTLIQYFNNTILYIYRLVRVFSLSLLSHRGSF